MGREYSIIIDLDLQYDELNIQLLISKGIQQGLMFHKFIWDNPLDTIMPIDANESAKAIIEGDNGMHNINLQIKNTFTSLSFINRGMNLAIMMTNFNYPWLKKFDNDNGQDVDIGRYAKVMLDFVSDFIILEMRIEKS